MTTIRRPWYLIAALLLFSVSSVFAQAPAVSALKGAGSHALVIMPEPSFPLVLAVDLLAVVALFLILRRHRAGTTE